MTCGMCAGRIRNKLNKIDGVHASVDFATGIATVDAGRDISVSELCEAVRQAGYGARQRAHSPIENDVPDPVARHAGGPLRRLLMLILHWMTSRW